MPRGQHLFPIIRTARDAADLVRPTFDGLRSERLAVLHLASDRRLLGMVEGVVEAAEGVTLPIRAIVADALRFGSAGLVLAHNHPSGDDAPSAADVATTRRLAMVLGELDLVLHDHLIFGRSGVSSFRALGLL